MTLIASLPELAPPVPISPAPLSDADEARRAFAWTGLPPLPLPVAPVAKRRLPSVFAPQDPAAAQFDVLRTRMLGATEERGWNRIGLTQPRNRPATAFAAANLAFSLARRPSLRVLLVDLDLRTPRLALALRVGRAPELGAALREGADLAPAVGRFGDNLAFLGNAVPDALAGETLQEPRAIAALSGLVAELAPDVTLLVLPPMLEGDAGLAGLSLADALLMVSDGTSTVLHDLQACDRLNEDGPPILGVVLVEAEG